MLLLSLILSLSVNFAFAAILSEQEASSLISECEKISLESVKYYERRFSLNSRFNELGKSVENFKRAKRNGDLPKFELEVLEIRIKLQSEMRDLIARYNSMDSLIEEGTKICRQFRQDQKSENGSELLEQLNSIQKKREELLLDQMDLKVQMSEAHSSLQLE